MRVVFFGATELGYQCCLKVIDLHIPVVGIFTIPRTFTISYSKNQPVTNINYRDFHQLGEQLNIPVISVEDKMINYLPQLEMLQPDLLLAIGWYYLIPRSLRQLATKGCVGIHASLLPKYRGGAPLVWAMINGEKETGVTLFYLEDGVDTGDIIAQEKFPIEETDNIKDVLEKATRASIRLIEKYIPMIAEGNAPRQPQDHSLATQFPQRKPSDGLIDWTWEPERIRNFIRAQTKPYPGAFTYIGNKKVTIWDADITLL